jgi:hypothetical protein
MTRETLTFHGLLIMTLKKLLLVFTMRMHIKLAAIPSKSWLFIKLMQKLLTPLFLKSSESIRKTIIPFKRLLMSMKMANLFFLLVSQD